MISPLRVRMTRQRAVLLCRAVGRPMWLSTLGCSTTSAFFVAGVAGGPQPPRGHQLSKGQFGAIQGVSTGLHRREFMAIGGVLEGMCVFWGNVNHS